jgi:hypothetical protein
MVLATPAVAFCVRIDSKALRPGSQAGLVPMLRLYFALADILTSSTDWNAAQFLERATGFLTDDEGARADQARALISNWLSEPIFGSGFGQGVSETVRDDERPWIYELYYLLILFNTGIVGAALYSALLIVPGRTLVGICTRGAIEAEVVFPVLVAYIVFLIGSASNPYLGSFDFMFVVFFALALSNCFDRRVAFRRSLVQIAADR